MKYTSVFTKRHILAAALALALPAGMAIAGPGHGSKSASGKPGKATEVTRTITVIMNDIRFDKHQIEVRPGETVRFVLKNEGEILHEFNVGSPHDHAKHQKEMMMMVEMGMLTATGFNREKANAGHQAMGHGAMKHDDPNSVLVKPGETKELIWQFGRAPKLEFACNLPGHYEAGMVGQFRIRG